jgi:hypothetical protein
MPAPVRIRMFGVSGQRFRMLLMFPPSGCWCSVLAVDVFEHPLIYPES